MTLPQFLDALTDPSGLAIALGMIFSWLVEYVPAWGTLAPKYKRPAFAFLCVLVPVLARAVQINLGLDVNNFDRWWEAAYTGAVLFMSGSLSYLFQKESHQSDLRATARDPHFYNRMRQEGYLDDNLPPPSE